MTEPSDVECGSLLPLSTPGASSRSPEDIRYLEPGSFALFRNEGGGLRLTLGEDRSFLRVKAKRCFPHTMPEKYISLRDGADEEIGVIRDLAHIDRRYRVWIEEDLEIRYFVPIVTSILSIRQRFGGIEWMIETDRGPKRIITKGLHDTMTEIEPGRSIITDVDGNRYDLSLTSLDDMSKQKLERML